MLLNCILFTLAGMLVRVDGYSTGPPAASCPSMIPSPLSTGGHGAPPSTAAHPFAIAGYKSSYKPGETLWFKLYTTNSAFKGNAIQMQNGVGVAKGTIKPRPGSTKQGTQCSDTQLGHTDNSAKYIVVFSWTAPSTGEGTLYLTTTIVQDLTTFWVNQKLWTLTDETETTTSTTTTTTVTTTTSTTTVITTTQSTQAPPLPTFETVAGSACPVDNYPANHHQYLNIDANGNLTPRCYTDAVLMLSTHLIASNVTIVSCDLLGYYADPWTNMDQWPGYVGVSNIGFQSSSQSCTSMANVVNSEGQTAFECDDPTGTVTKFRGWFHLNLLSFGASWPNYCIKLEQAREHDCIYVYCTKTQ